MLKNKYKIDPRWVKLQKKWNEIYKELYAEEIRNVDILKAQARKVRKIFPDINKIFLPPIKGGPPISYSTAKRMASHPETGVLLGYYLLQHPRIAKKIYYSCNDYELLDEIFWSKKSFKKILRKYIKYEAQRNTHKRHSYCGK